MASRPLSQPDSEFARIPAINLVLLQAPKERRTDVSMGKEGQAVNKGSGLTMHLRRLAGVMALLALASCSAPPRESSGPIIDTLPSGLRVVTNVPPWLDGSSRGLIQATEELRIGTALSGGPEEFGVVSGLEVDGEGRIYVSDAFNHEIRVFDPGGAFSHAFGKRGEGPGEMERPYGVLLDDKGRLWVRDLRNMRFSLFKGDGTFIEVKPIRYQALAGPWRAGFDSSGHMVEWGFLRPFIINPDGSRSWDDRARNRTERTLWPLRFSDDGLQLDTLPPLRYDLPEGRQAPFWRPDMEFAIDRQGSVWFAVRDRYQVWRRSLEGDTLLTFSFPAEAVMDVSRGEPFLVVDRILTDEAGYVYVFPQAKGVPAAGTAVDAFDSTGVFMARILLPVKLQREPLLVRSGALYGVTRDSLAVSYVVKLGLHLPGGD
jgi:sugar lactone lactonase YvrE